ncbi:hypothetical protein HDU96_000551 [Phlyctochytrium bullatum]|nr:hypothetical protein HDU96_000551 [Phlyctochytrium bullatum]
MQKEKEYLDDLDGELILLDDDDIVKYKIGDTFADMPLSECRTLLEEEQASLSSEISELEEKASRLKGSMDELKVKLYARFGKNINLEK